MRNNSGFGIVGFSCDLGPVVPTDIHHNSVTGNGGDGIYTDDWKATIQNNTVRTNAQAGPEFHGIHVSYSPKRS